MVPDDWLSDAENGKPRRALCNAPIRLPNAADQFSTIREFMLEIRGFHAPLAIPIPTESFMLHCNRNRRSHF
jgi:hypothetical protein